MAIRIHCFGKTHCIPELLPMRGLQKLGKTLSAIYSEIAEEVRAVKERDPAAKSDLEVLLLYSGVHAILAYRVSHKLYLSKHYLPARAVSQLARFVTGIEIHPGATIGHNFFIDHGSGVVIGETAEVHKGVVIYQGVTLGAKSFPLDEQGNPIKHIPRHPILEDGVIVYSNATILGRVTIGKEAIIGANVWITQDVPSGAKVSFAKS